MKVLWLTPMPSMFKNINESFIGSGWISALEETFRKNNVELRVAFSSQSVEYKKHIDKNFIYYELPVYKYKRQINNYIRKLFNVIENEKIVLSGIKKVIEDYNPDIIQIWGTENPLGLVAKISEIPQIIHFQGNLTVYYHKYYSAYSKKQLHSIAKPMEWLKKSSFIYHDRFYKKKVLREQEIFRICKNVFGRTDWDRRITKVLAPQANYFHCEEALRGVFYKGIWVPPKNEKFVIVSVFRDNIYKGLETVYQTSELLTNNKVNFEWRIIGIDQNSISARLERRYLSLNKKVPVKLLGGKRVNELLNELQKANILVHPSHIDNSPNSVCEAMLLGIPIITTCAGGIPSLIEDKKSGYLIQDGDPWAMAGTIMEVIKNYNEAIALGENAKNIAKKRHNSDSIFNYILNTYKTLINQ